MEAGFQNAMDNLASNGILNFDANAFVIGTQPRYVGDPDGELHLPLDRPLPIYHEPKFNIMPGEQLHGAPHKDAFTRETPEKASNIPWKTLLFGGLMTFFAVLGGVKLYNYIRSRRGATPTAPAPATPTTPASGGRVRTFFSNAWTKTKGFFSTVGTKIKALPTWAKITGGVVVGLGVLYGAYKVFSSGNSNIPPEMQSGHGGH